MGSSLADMQTSGGGNIALATDATPPGSQQTTSMLNYLQSMYKGTSMAAANKDTPSAQLPQSNLFNDQIRTAQQPMLDVSAVKSGTFTQPKMSSKVPQAQLFSTSDRHRSSKITTSSTTGLLQAGQNLFERPVFYS